MRSRNIKPSFFMNDDLAAGGPCVMLLFAGLWCIADKEGRLKDKPARIQAQVFPFFKPELTESPLLNNGELTVSSRSINDLLFFLEQNGFIERYEVGGEGYIQITNFHVHQRPHHTETPSKIPAKPEGYKSNRELTVNSPLEDGEYLPDSLIPDSLIHKEKTPLSCSGKPKKVRAAKLQDKPCPHKEIIDLYHEVLPELPKIRTWPEHRKKALKTRWNEDSSRQSLDWWRGFFLEKVKPSDFLCGRVNEWTASLDWIILPRNFAKVLDGFYVRDVKKNGTNGHHTETEAEREARLERYRSYANA